MVWPRDERGVLLPSRETEEGGEVLAPLHAQALFLRKLPAVNDTEGGGAEMSLDVGR